MLADELARQDAEAHEADDFKGQLLSPIIAIIISSSSSSIAVVTRPALRADCRSL
jgi:hypothetical protein